MRARFHWSFVALGALQLTAAPPAYAQAPGGVDEIMVTAQRRAENVQDVPIAVAAFSGTELQERGVGEIVQLASLTPSVQLTNSSQIVGSPSSLAGFIRGIGQDDFSAQFEPGVGTYIDGVYLARTVGANVNLLDVERVEILKGPQGTLFGRNTIGGAISVVTRAPQEEFSARGNVTFGEFNRIDMGGMVNLPLVPQVLLASLAVNYSERDGYQDRVSFPGSENFVFESPADFLPTGAVTGIGARDDLGGGEQFNSRLQLLWSASDSVRLRLAADYSNSEQGAASSRLIRTVQAAAGAPSLAGVYNVCINTPAAVLDIIGLGAVCGPRLGPGTGLAGVNVDADPTNDRLAYDDRFVTDDIDQTYGAGNNFSDLENYGFTGTLEIDLSAFATLKSITAWREQEWNIGLDLDGSPVVIFEPTVFQSQEQFSQELQLSGVAIGDRLDWLVGAYYFNETVDEEQNPIFAGGIFSVANPASFETTSFAVFTHLNFDLTERLGLTLGARYTEEEKHLDPSQLDVNLFLQKLLALPPVLYPDPSDVRQLLPTARQEQSFDNFSPRIGLEYSFTDDVMIYASYSQGYKSGGWTTRVTAPVPEVPTFAPEEAETYELGVKSEFLDRRLQINAAAFTTKYGSIQLLIQRGVSPTFENAGDARIEGLEVETRAILSDVFRFNASVGYINAEFTDVDDPTGVITLDSDLPRVPEWTAHFGPEARFSLDNSGMITLRGDVSYRSEVANDAENTPDLYADAVTLVGLSASYEAPSGAWEVTVGGANMTDERYLINGTNQSTVGAVIGVYNTPAQWYVSLRGRF